MRLKQSVAWLPSTRSQWLLPILVNAGVLLSLPAAAAEGDVLRPYVGISMAHDDNIFGASDERIASDPALKQSDTARRLEAGLIFDKTFSQQRVTANANFDRTSFNRYENLDYSGRDIRANWNWRTGTTLQGNLGATHTRALATIQDSLTQGGTPSQVPNVRTQDRQYLDASWRLHPSWQLRGGASHYELEYEQAGPQGVNRSVNDIEAGVDYIARSGSSAGIQVRRAEGRFPVSPVSNYSQDEVKSRIDWKITGKTDLLFLVGWVGRDHDFEPERDFSGFNGRVNATWRATYKTTINASLWREIGSVDDQTALFSLNKGLSIGAGWEISEKTRFDGYYQHERRDYDPANVARDDRVNYGSVVLTYYPTRNWRLQASLYQTRQSSTNSQFAYRSEGATLGTRYEF